MLTAVYHCVDESAVIELVANLDPKETLTISCGSGFSYDAVYRSPHLIKAATEDIGEGVTLLGQNYEPNGD